MLTRLSLLVVFFAILFVLPATFAAAEPAPPPAGISWARRYSGYPAGADVGRAIAVDKDGNVVVAGTSFGGPETGVDYAILKYDQAGNLLWARRYNGVPGVNGEDEPHAITTDAAGNVIVTGKSAGVRGVGGLPEIATVKIAPNGTPLWAQRFYVGPTGHEVGRAVKTDAAGNVYVAGAVSSPNNQYEDAILIKYSPTGARLWTRRFEGKLKDNDSFLQMKVDGPGNAFVTGYTTVSGLNLQDIITQKYSPAGRVLWSKNYNGEPSVEDYGESIAIDKQGNVIVAGSRGEGCFDDLCFSYVTIKYSRNGRQLWVKLYNPPPTSDDIAHGVAVDANGNIYVTGQSSWKSAFYDYVTVKYDPAGKQAWARRYDGPGKGNDQAYSVAVDSKGNLVVGGFSYTNFAVLTDWAVVKYTPAGGRLWAVRYNGPSNQDDMGFAVAVGPGDVVYATGFSQSPTNEDLTTLKLQP